MRFSALHPYTEINVTNLSNRQSLDRLLGRAGSAGQFRRSQSPTPNLMEIQ
jgi:hypothetical protein